jgi:hypothetical protein
MKNLLIRSLGTKNSFLKLGPQVDKSYCISLIFMMHLFKILFEFILFFILKIHILYLAFFPDLYIK